MRRVAVVGVRDFTDKRVKGHALHSEQQRELRRKAYRIEGSCKLTIIILTNPKATSDA